MPTLCIPSSVAVESRKGWTVTSLTASQAILQRKKKIGLWLNLILTVITGVWIIVVLYRALNRKQQTLILSVDPYGRVSRA